jgi:hypothetical protein
VFLYPCCVEDSEKFIVNNKLKTPEGKKIGLVNQEKYRKYGKGRVRTGNCEGYILKLEPGCILFFRQDIIHGGSGKKIVYYLIKIK